MGGPRPSLVATDLDGTLLRGDGTVSARTLASLGRLTRLGVPHVIVTGQPVGGCARFVHAFSYRGLRGVCRGPRDGSHSVPRGAGPRRVVAPPTHAGPGMVEVLPAGFDKASGQSWVA